GTAEVKVCVIVETSTPNCICRTGTESIGTTGGVPEPGCSEGRPDAAVRIAFPRLPSIGRSPPCPEAITGAKLCRYMREIRPGGGVGDCDGPMLKSTHAEMLKKKSEMCPQTWTLSVSSSGDVESVSRKSPDAPMLMMSSRSSPSRCTSPTMNRCGENDTPKSARAATFRQLSTDSLPHTMEAKIPSATATPGN